MRVNAVSPAASTIENRKSTTIATTIAQSLPLIASAPPFVGPGAVVTGTRSLRSEPRQELTLPLLHRRLFPRIGVVVVEQVQHAVHDEQRELVVERRTVLGRLRLRHGRTHHDVADQRRRLAALAGRTRTAAALVGLAAGQHEVVVHREREHVGGPGSAQELLVELGDRGAIHEEERELRGAGHLLLVDHQAGQADPPHHVDGDVVLLVAPEDRDVTHVLTPLTPSRASFAA